MVEEIIADEWYKAGVREGDILLVHSNIRRTLKRFMKKHMDISPQIILEAIISVIGQSGTLLLPLFNFDFIKGVPFDIRSTPSQMGALTEAGSLHPLAIRTGHPIYSFAVIGHFSEKFRGLDNFSGYGKDSPFSILHELNGKIAVLDLPDQNSMTFYHYVEEMNDVSYRFHKKFTGIYTDLSGNSQSRTYSLFVRNIDKGVLTHVDPTGELMWETGLYSGCRPGEGSGIRVVSAAKMYDFVSEIIKSGKAKGLLYRIESEDN